MAQTVRACLGGMVYLLLCFEVREAAWRTVMGNDFPALGMSAGEQDTMKRSMHAAMARAANPILTRAMGSLRAQRPPLPKAFAYEVRRGHVRIGHRSGTYAQIWFRTAGCLHDRRGECAMCNYGWSEPVTAEQIVASVGRALTEVGPVDVLYVSPSGSLLDENEVPRVALDGILELVRTTPSAEFLCEARPQHISADAISLLRRILGNKRVTVEMGLESADPWALQYCINKRLDLDEYHRAVTMLGSHDIRAFSNVLLGVPFLSDAETIADAVSSIQWALMQGTHSAVLFPSHVRRWTLLHWLWERGLYNPPSLWSLVEVLRRMGPQHVSRIGISWYWRPSDDDCIVDSPTTCARCISRVLPLLHEYRATRRYDCIDRLTNIRCACKDAWSSRYHDARGGTEFVAHVYHCLGQEFGGSWWERHGDAFVEQCVQAYMARPISSAEFEHEDTQLDPGA